MGFPLERLLQSIGKSHHLITFFWKCGVYFVPTYDGLTITSIGFVCHDKLKNVKTVNYHALIWTMSSVPTGHIPRLSHLILICRMVAVTVINAKLIGHT